MVPFPLSQDRNRKKEIIDFSCVDLYFVLQVVPLASVIVKEAMTDEDVLNCQKTIYNLVDMERKNDPLPISTVGTRGKGPKRLHAYLFLLMLDFFQKYSVDAVFIPNLKFKKLDKDEMQQTECCTSAKQTPTSFRGYHSTDVAVC